MRGLQRRRFRGLPGPGTLDDDALSVTAAMLSANLLDYADADDIPTVVAVRDFEDGSAGGIRGEGLRIGAPAVHHRGVRQRDAHWHVARLTWTRTNRSLR